MRPAEDQLLARIEAHVGSSTEVRPVTMGVLAWIGSCLWPRERDLIADELPRSLAAAVRRADGLAMTLDGHRREIVASVCRILAEELSTEASDLLRRALPAALRELFVAGAPEGQEPSHVELTRASLAEGHPGARTPLSEAHPTRVQHGSVVAEPNPHGATKLSSTPGKAAERKHATLSGGRPGSERPLSDKDRR
jgi:uncharacterized protein (DUF2267 family)